MIDSMPVWQEPYQLSHILLGILIGAFIPLFAACDVCSF